jgi:hypothetical protein
MSLKATFRTTSSPRRRRGECGAAMVEAVVVLPVFVILFVSLVYVRDLGLAKQQAEMQARSCAWLYSASNCSFRGGLVPAECEGVLREGHVSASPDLEQALENGKSQILEQASPEGALSSVVAPLLGDAISAAFGRSLSAEVRREVARPSLYGGKTAAVTGRYHLACNLTPQEPEDVALDAWDFFTP